MRQTINVAQNHLKPLSIWNWWILIVRHVNKRTVPYKKLQARPHLCLNLCICDLWHRSLLIWTYPTTKRNKCTANKGFTTSISVLVKVQFLELFIFSHWIEPIEHCNKTFTDFFLPKIDNWIHQKSDLQKITKNNTKRIMKLFTLFFT